MNASTPRLVPRQFLSGASWQGGLALLAHLLFCGYLISNLVRLDYGSATLAISLTGAATVVGAMAIVLVTTARASEASRRVLRPGVLPSAAYTAYCLALVTTAAIYMPGLMVAGMVFLVEAAVLLGLSIKTAHAGRGDAPV